MVHSCGSSEQLWTVMGNRCLHALQAAVRKGLPYSHIDVIMHDLARDRNGGRCGRPLSARAKRSRRSWGARAPVA